MSTAYDDVHWDFHRYLVCRGLEAAKVLVIKWKFARKRLKFALCITGG